VSLQCPARGSGFAGPSEKRVPGIVVFGAPAARHRDQPEDLGMYPVAVALLRLHENATESPVFGFAEPAVADLVFRLAGTMRRAVLDDASFDDIREDSAKQAHRPDRGATTAAKDSLSAQFFGLHGHACLAGDDVVHQVIIARRVA
jgi:hypothetical protein